MGTGEASAKYSDLEGEKARYDSSGAIMTGGGGGGGGGSGGPDLSGLLAQFLPKKEDEAGPKGGILDFGGRDHAAEGPVSLLDRNTNIFERIHKTYQEKNKAGNVGG